MNEIGDLRPSQLIYTFGVGALIDLPNMSSLIMGLDDWDTRRCTEIIEERLLAAIQSKRGSQLKRLLLPPIAPDENVRDPTAPPIGVPVAPFPRWLRCPVCDALATIESGVFNLVQDRYRADKTRYVHASCTKGNSPTGLPVRFLLACREGHLADFPWIEYLHQGRVPCKPSILTLREYGAAGDASDIIVECKSCGANKRMADAFDRDKFKMKCTAHHPHLRQTEPCGCVEEARTILLGASNSWFPIVMTALSIPPAGADKLAGLIEEHWGALKDIPSLEVAKFVTAPSRLPALAEHSAEDIWAGILKKKAGPGPSAADEPDLKVAEWNVLTGTKLPPPSKNFSVKRVNPPEGYESRFEKTVLLEKLREVRALMAFTRIESKGDFAAAAVEEDDGRSTPLGRGTPDWLPASEVRGEGIFLRFKESAVQAWESKKEVLKLDQEFFRAHSHWRRLRNQEPATAGYPGIRFVLIHSLTHALMRQIALECGYTAASVRERIYCRGVGDKDGPMAGLMIYTAASDSEGTLGGLVQLGQPLTLGRLLDQALEEMRICGSDPLCAEHSPTGDGRGVHGACCHACLFAPETSCEKGNRFLDRTALVATFASKGAEFFIGGDT
jgi:hypothetical protein